MKPILIYTGVFAVAIILFSVFFNIAHEAAHAQMCSYSNGIPKTTFDLSGGKTTCTFTGLSSEHDVMTNKLVAGQLEDKDYQTQIGFIAVMSMMWLNKIIEKWNGV